jgi:hypothetical protein
MKALPVWLLVLVVFSGLAPVYSQPVRLDPTVNLDAAGIGEFQAVSDNAAYKVWKQLGEGRDTIWFTRSLDGGQTWEEPRCIYNPPAPLIFIHALAIAAAGENVYVAWRMGDFVTANLIVSNDWGETFELRRHELVEHLSGAGVALSASGSNLFMAWGECTRVRCLGDPRDMRIYLAFSSNGAQTLRVKEISDDAPASRSLVRLLSSKDNFYVLWRENGRLILRHGTMMGK